MAVDNNNVKHKISLITEKIKATKLYSTVLYFSNKARNDSLAAYAAQITFFILLSIVPLLTLILLIASNLEIIQNDFVNYIIDFVPSQYEKYAWYIIDDAIFTNTAPFTIVTAMMALWSSSKIIQSIAYGLDKVYETSRKKNYFFTRLICTLYTFIFILLFIVIIVIHVFGTGIASKIVSYHPELMDATVLVLSLRNIVSFVILFAFFLVMYCRLPDRKTKIRYEFIGAALASAIWVLMTDAFSYYIQNVSRNSYLYGSLTSLVLFLIWLYACIQVFLYGAEYNYYRKKFLLEDADINMLKKQNKDKNIYRH